MTATWKSDFVLNCFIFFFNNWIEFEFAFENFLLILDLRLNKNLSIRLFNYYYI